MSMYAACNGDGCPIRLSCYRAWIAENTTDPRQAFFQPAAVGEDCDDWIPRKCEPKGAKDAARDAAS